MIDWMQLDPRTLGRMAAALWSRLGRETAVQDLAWADDLLGTDGRRQLWSVLNERAIFDSEGQINAWRLSTWLTELSNPTGRQELRLLWTLPPEHPSAGSQGASYISAFLELIGSAKHELLLMSPFIQSNGFRQLEDQIYLALSRNVRVIIIGHELNDLASHQSQALKRLRREAEVRQAQLSAFAATPEAGLLHAKLAVADRERAILGSANMTGPGLTLNFEAGVLLPNPAATEIAAVFHTLLTTRLVKHVFSTFDREAQTHERQS